jgi:hypothetical protein
MPHDAQALYRRISELTREIRLLRRLFTAEGTSAKSTGRNHQVTANDARRAESEARRKDPMTDLTCPANQAGLLRAT